VATVKRIILLCEAQADYAGLKVNLDNGWILDPTFNGGHAIALQNSTVWPLIKYESDADRLEALVKESGLSDIVDVQDVPHSSVADLVTKGFQVFAIYQKNVIVVKRMNGGPSL
jgi:hypothetical protein